MDDSLIEDDEEPQSLQKPRVFRVRGHAGRTWMAAGGIIPLILTAATGAEVLVIAVPIGALGGYLIGRGVRQDECSFPSCGAPLPFPADHCPRCEGRIAGEIARPEDYMEIDALLARLSPEEAFARYREQRAEARKRMLTNPLNVMMAAFVLLVVVVVVVGQC